MVERKTGGSIVNVSSQASSRAIPLHTVYGSSKAALDQMTRSMAQELGKYNVRALWFCIVALLHSPCCVLTLNAQLRYRRRIAK